MRAPTQAELREMFTKIHPGAEVKFAPGWDDALAPWNRLKSVPFRVARAVRFFLQRRLRGFDDSVTWNLNVEVAQWFLPRLRCFRSMKGNATFGHPNDLTPERWDEVLGEIEWFLSVHASDEGTWGLHTPEQHVRYEAAKIFFGQYFGCLWW